MSDEKMINSEPPESLVAWLQDKRSAAERELKAHEQGAATWRSGTERDWRGAPHDYLTREQRLKLAEIDDRIANKRRHDIQMIDRLLDLLAQGSMNG